MPSSFTNSLRLTLPATGELSGTWGSTVNDGVTTLIEKAVAGYTSIAMTDADYTLSQANGAADESRFAIINITGTLTAARNVVAPDVSKIYVFKNSTTGGFALTLKTSGGTGISVPNGKTVAVWFDGSNNTADITSYISGALTVNGAFIANGAATVSGLATFVGGLTLGDASSDALTINSNTASIPNNLNITGGNLGLGVTPVTTLDVNGNITARGNIFGASSAVGYSVATDPSLLTGALIQLFGSTHATPNLIVGYTAGAARWRTGAEGNFAIGTDNTVGAKLTVAGSAEAAFTLFRTAAAADTGRWRLLTNTSNEFVVGTINDAYTVGSDAYVIARSGATTVDSHSWRTGGTERLKITSTGTIQDGGGLELGYRDIPRVTGGIERGKVFATAVGFTLNTGSAAGSAYSVYNDSAAAITVTQGAGLTLRLTGTTTTGNRTIAARGMATIWFNSTTEAVMSGPGVS